MLNNKCKRIIGFCIGVIVLCAAALSCYLYRDRFTIYHIWKLKSGSLEARASAAETLGSIGTSSCKEALTAALGDENALIRSAAYRSLQRIVPLPEYMDEESDFIRQSDLRVSTSSFDKMVELSSPTLSLDFDLAWVRFDEAGITRFALARVYLVLQPGSARFGLLNPPSSWENVPMHGNRYVSCEALVTQRDDDPRNSYASILSVGPERDTVYEVAWPSTISGNGLHVFRRLLYFLKSKDNKWDVLGEGPTEHSGKSGGFNLLESTVVRRDIQWENNPRGPVKIFFTQAYIASKWGESGGAASDCELRLDYTLGEGLPGKLDKLAGPYMLAEEGDTAGAIAIRTLAWEEGWMSAKSEEENIKEVLEREILQLNSLADGKVIKGMAIRIPEWLPSSYPWDR